jgi:hypothetical protein
MNESEIHLKNLSDIRKNIEKERLELIDFDCLLAILDKAQENEISSGHTAAELKLLKNDYRDRILGMLKANLACRPNENESLWAARLTGYLDEIDAEELATLYLRVATRFRDNFPASFKYVKFSNSKIPGRSWDDYKI